MFELDLKDRKQTLLDIKGKMYFICQISFTSAEPYNAICDKKKQTLFASQNDIFWFPCMKVQSFCCHFSIGIGVTLLSFTSKFFYVMSMALSGQLSCMGTGLVLKSPF